MSDSRPEWAPASIDPDQPSSALVWDHFLDGSHDFEVDRRVAEQAISFKPGLNHDRYASYAAVGTKPAAG